MADVVVLAGVELMPVVELEPLKFARSDRPYPPVSIWQVPGGPFRYWSECLSDSGITGLRPLEAGRWHVPTVNFDAGPNLQRYLKATFQEWGGIDALADPDGKPVLDGGLALRRPAGEVLVEPMCCVDLGHSAEWKTAARYRGDEWQRLWIGHPWMSYRYQDPWLVLSDLHESDAPVARWLVRPNELVRAAEGALVELARFASDIARVLPALGFNGDAALMGRRLAGLVE